MQSNDCLLDALIDRINQFPIPSMPRLHLSIDESDVVEWLASATTIGHVDLSIATDAGLWTLYIEMSGAAAPIFQVYALASIKHLLCLIKEEEAVWNIDPLLTMLVEFNDWSSTSLLWKVLVSTSLSFLILESSEQFAADDREATDTRIFDTFRLLIDGT